MIINHNMNALNAHRNMTANTNSAGKSMEKLSSGLRINRAGDDAAGLAISEKMRGQIRGLDQASRNAQDGISMIQTAEGALNETHNILQRMRELSVQAGNDTNTSDDRKEIQKEIEQLTQEIDRIGNNTEFNTQKLLNGNKSAAAGTEITPAVAAKAGVFEINLADKLKQNDVLSVDGVEITLSGTTNDLIKTELEAKFTGYEVTVTDAKLTFTQKKDHELDKEGMSLKLNGTELAVDPKTKGVSAKDAEIASGKVTLQVGANEKQVIELEISDMRAASLGVDKIDITTKESASAAITTVDNAIKGVSAERAKLGAVQNRLEYTTANLNNTSENLTAAESRVRDVDMAKEMMNFSKNNILSQAAQAMLAQANQQPQGVLQLLR
ncbi:MAG: flagellin [Clostridium sp.]|uniref:Flagellin n=1 Tax=Clostridium paraputrificum TaxID=29363 RepID=A0A6N3GYB5_9CLOT|nr:flagellin [Clostridium sp.]MBS5926286.1 flagellin [Clostridium sp.]